MNDFSKFITSSSSSELLANRSFKNDFRIFDSYYAVPSFEIEIIDGAALIRALSILQGNVRTPQSPQAGFYFLVNRNTLHSMMAIKCCTRDQNIHSTVFLENPDNTLFKPLTNFRDEKMKKWFMARHPCNIPSCLANVHDVLDSLIYCFHPYNGLKQQQALQQQQHLIGAAGSSVLSSFSGKAGLPNSAKMFQSFFKGTRIRSTFTSHQHSANNNRYGQTFSSSGGNNNNNKTADGQQQQQPRLTFGYDASRESELSIDVRAELGREGEVDAHSRTYNIGKDKFSSYVPDIERIRNSKDERDDNREDHLSILRRLPNNISITELYKADVVVLENTRTVSDMNGFESGDLMHAEEEKEDETGTTIGKNKNNNNRNNNHRSNNNKLSPVNGIVFKAHYVRELLADIVTMECSEVNVSWTKSKFTVIGRDSDKGEVVVSVDKPLTKDQLEVKLDSFERAAKERERMRLNHPNHPSSWNVNNNNNNPLHQQDHYHHYNMANENMYRARPVRDFVCESEQTQATYSAAHFATAFGLEVKGEVHGGKIVPMNIMMSGHNNNGGGGNGPDHNNNSLGGNPNFISGDATSRPDDVGPIITVQINQARQLRVIHDDGKGVKIVMVIQSQLRDTNNNNNINQQQLSDAQDAIGDFGNDMI